MGRWALVALLVVGCKKPEVAVPDAGALSTGDEVRPVYPMDAKATPSAERLCRALYSVRAERRQACCHEGAGPDVMQLECVRMLSAAVADHAVTLDEAALAECERAVAVAHEGCRWAGGARFEAPEACTQLVTGTLAAGAKCRSSVECVRGLRCVGVGPTDPGKCAAPSPDDTLCAVAVDALAAAAFQRLDDAHPECAGACGRRRCGPALDAGVACSNTLECGAGRHCAGTCVAGAYARAGEACVQGACAAGLQCVEGKCAELPKTSPCSTTVVLVRHAEKATAPKDDPPLTDVGQARALLLAQTLQKLPIAAVYSTDFKRTRSTAAAVAEPRGLTVTLVDAKAKDHEHAVAREVLKEHRGETVLVVGHSNTLAGIAEALGGARPLDLCDGEFDRYFVVTIPPTGGAAVEQKRYGAHAADAGCR